MSTANWMVDCGKLQMIGVIKSLIEHVQRIRFNHVGLSSSNGQLQNSLCQWHKAFQLIIYQMSFQSKLFIPENQMLKSGITISYVLFPGNDFLLRRVPSSN